MRRNDVALHVVPTGHGGGEALAEQEPYDGHDRREQKVFTPQFVWQIATWFFAQFIAAAAIYVAISNRLTVVEVLVAAQKEAVSSVISQEVTARQMLEARIVNLEKSNEHIKAYLEAKDGAAAPK